jgi:hypothetical protein
MLVRLEPTQLGCDTELCSMRKLLTLPYKYKSYTELNWLKYFSLIWCIAISILKMILYRQNSYYRAFLHKIIITFKKLNRWAIVNIIVFFRNGHKNEWVNCYFVSLKEWVFDILINHWWNSTKYWRKCRKLPAPKFYQFT